MSKQDTIGTVATIFTAETQQFEAGVKRVVVGNDAVQKSIVDTAKASTAYADSEAKTSERLRVLREKNEAAVKNAAVSYVVSLKNQSLAEEAYARTKASTAAVIAAAEAKLLKVRDQSSKSADRLRTTISNQETKLASADTRIVEAKALVGKRLDAVDAERLDRQKKYNAMEEREAERNARRLIQIENQYAREYMRGQGKTAGGAGAPGAGDDDYRRKRMSPLEMGVQNSSYQLTDVFTQITAGTDPSRAIAMQAPQMLAGFGAIGAAAGLLAAILIPLAGNFMDLADKTAMGTEEFDAFKEAADELGASVGRLSELNDQAKLTALELRKEYGGMADEMLRTIEAQRELQLADVQEKATNAMTALGGGIDMAGYFKALDQLEAARDRLEEAGPMGSEGFKEAMKALTFEEIHFDQAAEGLDKLAKGFNLTGRQAEDFARVWRDAMIAAPEDRLPALEKLRETIRAAVGDSSSLTGEQLRFAQAIEAAIESMIRLGAVSGESRDAIAAAGENARGINFDPAIAGAKALTSQLLAAQRAIAGIMLSQAGALRAAQLRVQYAGDAVGLAGAEARVQVEDQMVGLSGKEKDDLVLQPHQAEQKAREIATLEAQATALEAAAREAAKPAEAGGGGGGGKAKIDKVARAAEKAEQKEWNETLREAGSIYASTRTEAEKYAEELANIQRLEKEGVLGLSPEQREQAEGMTAAQRAALIAETATQNAQVAKRAIQELNEEFSKSGEFMADLEGGARGAFKSLIKGSGDAKDAIIGMLDSIADRLLNQAFDGIWGALFGGPVAMPGATPGILPGAVAAPAAAGGGNIFASLLGAIPGFANGTPGKARNGLALVGERGPELIPLGSGAQVLSNERSRRLLAGGGGGGRMSIDLNLSDDLDARIASTSSEIALNTTKKGLSEYSRSVAPSRQAQIARNPRKKS